PIIDLAGRPDDDELAFRRRSRDYVIQIRRIRHEYLGRIRVAELRSRGIDELRTLTDPAAFMPLVEELSGQEILIEYQSPVARAQKASEKRALREGVQGAMEMAAVNPSVMDNYDLDKIVANRDWALANLVAAATAATEDITFEDEKGRPSTNDALREFARVLSEFWSRTTNRRFSVSFNRQARVPLSAAANMLCEAAHRLNRGYTLSNCESVVNDPRKGK
ncbi:MAG: hypothetical protein IIC81_05410, partial [Chloroflexi bacterium]|nr:hypothetical protein [Chloroflexota bacterium]